MARLRVTSLLVSVLVGLAILGSLAVLGRTVVGDTPAMAVLVLVLVLFVLLGIYGERFAGDGTPYW